MQTVYDLLYENTIDAGSNEMRKINNKHWCMKTADGRWNSSTQSMRAATTNFFIR